MNLQECPRARSLRAPLAVLLACLVAFATACSNPEKAKAEHVARGEAFLKERRWQEASLEFRNAIQIDDKLAAAHWGLAQAYEQLGRGGEYIEELQVAVKLDPANVVARIRLANGYLAAFGRQKQADFLVEAERLAGEVVAREPNNPDGQILLANVTFFKGDTAKAEAMIKEAVALDPRRVESHMGLARFYLQTNRPADAERVYNEAIAVNDRSSLAHVEYGKFLTQTNRKDDAEVQFRKAVEVDPDNRDVRWVLASYYLVNNRLRPGRGGLQGVGAARLGQARGQGAARRLLRDGRPLRRRREPLSGDRQDLARLHARPLPPRRDQPPARRHEGRDGATPTNCSSATRKTRTRSSCARACNVAAGKLKDAIADLKTVLDGEPRSKLGLFFMSDALYRDGQLEQARARAGELERYYQDFLPAKLLQIQIGLDSGDAEGSKRDGRRASEEAQGRGAERRA